MEAKKARRLRTKNPETSKKLAFARNMVHTIWKDKIGQIYGT